MGNCTQRNLLICFCAACLLLVGDSVAQQASPSGDSQAAASATVSVTVPRLIRFSGTVKNTMGQPRTGAVGMTFALYKEQEGGAALWQETQNVAADVQGNYVVLLGSTAAAGIPMEAFSGNEARWLGVQAEGQAEQRVLLVSVPYALKAADAETPGGMPASSFVLAAPAANAGSGSSGSQTGGTTSTSSGAGNSSSGVSPATTCTSGSCAVSTTAPGGTTNTLPLFTDPTTVQNSVLSQAPCPFDSSQTCVGITNTNPPTTLFTPSSSPTRVLDINGEARVGGGNIFLQRNLTDLAGRRNWAIGTETFNVGDFSIFVSASNSTFPSLPVFTALSNGWMGIGVGTPHANLEIAGSGGGLLVDSPGTITGNGSGLTNLPAGQLSGTVTQAALTGANGSGLTNLNAANLTGTVPSGSLPANVALLNATNAFSVPQTVSAAPSATGAALQVAATGSSGVNGLSASTNDPAGFGALITNSVAPSSSGSGGAYIFEVLDSTAKHGIRVNANGFEASVPIAQLIPNDATGTTLNTLVRYTNSNTVATVPTSGTFAATGVIGVVVNGAGTTGNADIALAGLTNCIFDNATTAGDYVVPSLTSVFSTPTAGYCHDYGNASGVPQYPLSGVQIVGRVLATNATAGTPTLIYLNGGELRATGAVASVSWCATGCTFSSQTGAISATTLYTPLVSGLFRMNVYIVPTAGTTCTGGTGCINGRVSYHDDTQAQAFSFVPNTGLIGGLGENSAVIRAVAGQPIQFSTTYVSGTNLTYEAFVTLERLQ